jgi:simple sugar transport system ATP-binding protein
MCIAKVPVAVTATSSQNGAGPRFDSREVRFRGPKDARNAGIEVVYRDLALCENLSGAANVFLGRELRRRVAGLSIMDHAAMIRRAAQLFAELCW